MCIISQHADGFFSDLVNMTDNHATFTPSSSSSSPSLTVPIDNERILVRVMDLRNYGSGYTKGIFVVSKVFKPSETAGAAFAAFGITESNANFVTLLGMRSGQFSSAKHGIALEKLAMHVMKFEEVGESTEHFTMKTLESKPITPHIRMVAFMMRPGIKYTDLRNFTTDPDSNVIDASNITPSVMNTLHSSERKLLTQSPTETVASSIALSVPIQQASSSSSSNISTVTVSANATTTENDEEEIKWPFGKTPTSYWTNVGPLDYRVDRERCVRIDNDSVESWAKKTNAFTHFDAEPFLKVVIISQGSRDASSFNKSVYRGRGTGISDSDMRDIMENPARYNPCFVLFDGPMSTYDRYIVPGHGKAAPVKLYRWGKKKLAERRERERQRKEGGESSSTTTSTSSDVSEKSDGTVNEKLFNERSAELYEWAVSNTVDSVWPAKLDDPWTRILLVARVEFVRLTRKSDGTRVPLKDFKSGDDSIVKSPAGMYFFGGKVVIASDPPAATYDVQIRARGGSLSILRARITRWEQYINPHQETREADKVDEQRKTTDIHQEPQAPSVFLRKDAIVWSLAAFDLLLPGTSTKLK